MYGRLTNGIGNGRNLGNCDQRKIASAAPTKNIDYAI